MSPVGIALIVGFIIILVVCVMIDKNGNKNFKKQMEEQYPVKEAFDRAFVTEKGELLYRLESGTLLGYKKWNIRDIACIATARVHIPSSGHREQFSFLDKDRNVMRGEYLTPSKKKALKEKGYASFDMETGRMNDFVAFVKKHGPHINHSVNGKEVQD